MEAKKTKRFEVHWAEIDCRGRVSRFVDYDRTKAKAEKYAAWLKDCGAVQIEILPQGVR